MITWNNLKIKLSHKEKEKIRRWLISKIRNESNSKSRNAR